MQHKLTVILSADVVGYSGLMERDEVGTLRRLKENRKALFDPRVAAHGGRIFKLMGDGVLIEFASASSAVACALEIQEAMRSAEPDVHEDQRLQYRIGINLGDVIMEGDDIYGDGVNVAARLQTLAPVGGVALSRNVNDQVTGKVAAEFEDLGLHTVKNIARPVHVYAIRPGHTGPVKRAAPEESKRKLYICVLPFANMSGDAEQEYFSDGISEDIITDLSKVSALAVVSRNTAFTFKGKHVDLSQVARQLKVSHILEGSVRKSGNRVRITAQLIDGKTDEHVWAERWDRNLDDIFALQDEISEAIVKALRVKLLPEEKKAIEQRGTTNVEAFEVYLMARQWHVKKNMTDLRKSDMVIRLCKRAIELDSNYARPWALIAITRAFQFYSGKTDDNGREAAERALELDASLAEAHAALASSFISERDYDKAREEIQTALSLDPDCYVANKEAGRLAYMQNRHAEAILYYEKAATEEHDFSTTGLLITSYTAVGDKAGARYAAERTLQRAEAVVALEPDNGTAMSMGIGALAHLGHGERAKDMAKRALLLDPDNLNMRYNIACAFVVDLGDVETGLDILEPAIANFPKDRLAHAKIDPDFDGIRDHPRFKAMIAAADARLATLP